ncbi:IS110 family transposase [Thiorhodococcus mannitoliphagus]|uniref:IS110 family transposase n=1 Tax=Thiorhodococcus mannitoliphagus TaxID=329406 RepID=A0A6P1DT49_9GAMM|nr:IS110 family transposase [Thiorhodococcus mannitoliphagus]
MDARHQGVHLAVEHGVVEILRQALGLNLKEHSSGTHQGRLAITKRGPSVARFYRYFAALRLIAHDPLVRRWFQVKTAHLGGDQGQTGR